jgi:hypothetical protein
MLTSKLRKLVLGLLTLAFMGGGVLACERLPTDVAGDDDKDSGCVVINGMLHCPD